MKRDTFVTLSLAAFGLVLVSFVLMGLSRLVVPYRLARVIATPTMLAAAALVAVLFVRSLLAVTGVRPLEE